MLYYGSDIDGPSFNPDQLNIRGQNLAEMLGRCGYVETVFLLLKGRMPSPRESAAAERLIVATPLCVPGDHPMLEVTRITARSGASTSRAMSAGYMVESEALFHALKRESDLGDAGFDEAQELALYHFALAPLLFLCSLRPEDPQPASRLRGLPYMEGIYRAIADGRDPEPGFIPILDAVMVAFTGGFGVFPPTVQVPRSAIGSGSPIPQAIAAGYATAGPNHAGACEEAMKFFSAFREGEDLGAAIRSAVDAQLSAGQLVFGYGHPLFDVDPRPPVLRALCSGLGLTSRYLEIYDETKRVVLERLGVHPNLDAAAAAIFLTLGFPPPAGTGIFLSARTSAMVAHALERKYSKPAFGLKRRISRKLLMNTRKEDFVYSPF